MPPARLLLYLATTGALGLSIYSILAAPPSIWAALVFLAGYVGLICLGVLVLSLRMFVDAVVRGPRDARGVALTFDDGPDPESTPSVLHLLERHDLKATFFLIGKKAERHPDLVRDIRDRGHTIGLHSYDHSRAFSLMPAARVRRDLERGLNVLEAITGQRPILFRPPIGHTNPIVRRVVDELDLVVVGWSVSGRDGLRGATPNAVAHRVARGLRDGAIVLLHDAAERSSHKPASIDALPKIIEAAESQQLEFVPLETWIPELG